MFTLFVSVGVSLVLSYVICVCRGAPLLFTLFVFVEEVMSSLRYLCLYGELLSYLRYLCL